MLWNKRKDFLKALLTSANLNSRNKDSFLDQHVENTVTRIHLLKSIFRRDERANNTKIRLHSRRNGSSNWYERLNEPDNTDNAKICVMNTIDKGKASFWLKILFVFIHEPDLAADNIGLTISYKINHAIRENVVSFSLPYSSYRLFIPLSRCNSIDNNSIQFRQCWIIWLL